jgi:hypothetical protein
MAVEGYHVPENPYQVEFDKIENEYEWQDYLERYFEWNDWTVVREAKPAGTEYRADLLVEHDQYGWFGIETKFANLGGRKMAEAHHQIVKKYRNRTYFGHKIDLWVYAPFYSFYKKPKSMDFVDRKYLIELTQGFFQRHGIGFLRCGSAKGAGYWEMQFELSSSDCFVGIERNSKRDPNMKSIRQTVQLRADQYSYK